MSAGSCPACPWPAPHPMLTPAAWEGRPRVSCAPPPQRPGLAKVDGSDPAEVKAKLEERILASAERTAFPRPGTKGEYRDTKRVPSPERRVWDRADDNVIDARMLAVEGMVQLQQYEVAHASLADTEERYEELTLENAMTMDAVSDTALESSSAHERIHRKGLNLAHLRRANFDKAAAEADALAALKVNEDWLASKHSKFALQREVARLERQLLTWRKSADSEFKAAQVQLDKALQEEQRQQAALESLEASIAESQEAVASMEQALEILREEPDGDAGDFGWFVDEEADILSGLDSLRVNIQKLDGLDSASKAHALARLEVRYQHLRSLTAETRRVNAAAQAFRADQQLNAVIFAVQQQITEVLEASSVRLLLLDEGSNQLWCMEGAAGEEEEVYLPLDVGLTGECVSDLEPVNCPSCSEDDRFDSSVDSPAANLVVNSMLVLPVVHPYQVSKALGVLQVHNKRGGTQAFSLRDVMVGKLLAEQAAISVKAGTELHSWSTRQSVMHRICHIGTALTQELNLRQLVSYLHRSCRELLKVTSLEVYACQAPDADPAEAEAEGNGGGSKKVLLVPDFGATGLPPLAESSPSYALIQEVVADGMGISVPDARKDDRFDSAAEDAQGGSGGGRQMQTRSLMVHPMRNSAGKVIGALQVSRAQPRRSEARPKAFSWEDAEALGMLSLPWPLWLSITPELPGACLRGGAKWPHCWGSTTAPG